MGPTGGQRLSGLARCLATCYSARSGHVRLECGDMGPAPDVGGGMCLTMCPILMLRSALETRIIATRFGPGCNIAFATVIYT